MMILSRVDNPMLLRYSDPVRHYGYLIQPSTVLVQDLARIEEDAFPVGEATSNLSADRAMGMLRSTTGVHSPGFKVFVSSIFRLRSPIIFRLLPELDPWFDLHLITFSGSHRLAIFPPHLGWSTNGISAELGKEFFPLFKSLPSISPPVPLSKVIPDSYGLPNP
jgi:hypothetical protein